MTIVPWLRAGKESSSGNLYAVFFSINDRDMKCAYVFVYYECGHELHLIVNEKQKFMSPLERSVLIYTSSEVFILES